MEKACDWCAFEDDVMPGEYLMIGGCLEELHVDNHRVCQRHLTAVMSLFARSALWCRNIECRIAELVVVDGEGEIVFHEQ